LDIAIPASLDRDLQQFVTPLVSAAADLKALQETSIGAFSSPDQRLRGAMEAAAQADGLECVVVKPP
jgi:hypothetical protein